MQPPQSRYEPRDFQTSGLSNNQTGPLGQRNNARGPRVNQPRPRQDTRNSGPGRNSINDDGNTYGKFNGRISGEKQFGKIKKAKLIKHNKLLG